MVLRCSRGKIIFVFFQRRKWLPSCKLFLFFKLPKSTVKHAMNFNKGIISIFLLFSYRPSTIFQRQACSSNSSSFIDPQHQLHQLEVEFSSDISNPSMMRHSSPASSSQTITTIASINRSCDNEFSLASSQSLHEDGGSVSRSSMILDGRLLIRASQRTTDAVGDAERGSIVGHQRYESFGGHLTVMNDTLDEKFNCNTSSSSKNRFTNDIHTRRKEFSCNKEESVSIMDHNTDASHCKNVNMCSISELNKNLTSLAHSSLLSHPTSSLNCSGDDGAMLHDERCEIDVR